MAGCLQSVNQQTIAAVGKSKVFFIWTVVKQSVGIALQVVGLIFWGMWGLLVGKVMASWFSYFVNIALVSKYVGYKYYHQLKDLSPVLIVSGVAFVVAYFGTNAFNLGMYPQGIVKVIFFFVVYFGWSIVFKPEAYKYTLSILDTFKKNRKKGVIV